MSKFSKIPVQIDRRIAIVYQNHCGKSSPLGTQIPSFFVIYSVFLQLYSPSWHCFPWYPSEQIQFPLILSQTSFVVPLELQLQSVIIWLSCNGYLLFKKCWLLKFLKNSYLPLQESPKSPGLHWKDNRKAEILRKSCLWK